MFLLTHTTKILYFTEKENRVHKIASWYSHFANFLGLPFWGLLPFCGEPWRDTVDFLGLSRWDSGSRLLVMAGISFSRVGEGKSAPSSTSKCANK